LFKQNINLQEKYEEAENSDFIEGKFEGADAPLKHPITPIQRTGIELLI